LYGQWFDRAINGFQLDSFEWDVLGKAVGVSIVLMVVLLAPCSILSITKTVAPLTKTNANHKYWVDWKMLRVMYVPVRHVVQTDLLCPGPTDRLVICCCSLLATAPAATLLQPIVFWHCSGDDTCTVGFFSAVDDSHDEAIVYQWQMQQQLFQQSWFQHAVLCL